MQKNNWANLIKPNLRTVQIWAMVISIILILLNINASKDSNTLESQLFIETMGIDVTDDHYLKVSIQFQNGNQQNSTENGASGNGNNEKMENLASAVGKDWYGALDLLRATLPRLASFTHLSQIVISEAVARSEAFGQIITDISTTIFINNDAQLIICRGFAGDFISIQEPLIGTRLSKYITYSMNNFHKQGYIPDSPLWKVMMLINTKAADIILPYADINDFTIQVPINEVGELPRTGSNANELYGSALFSNTRMVGVLSGLETQLYHIMIGDFDGLLMRVNNTVYRFRSRIGSTVSVSRNNDDWNLELQMFIAVQSTTPKWDNSPHIQTELTKRMEMLMVKLQAYKCDPVGYGAKAMKYFKSVPEWEAAGWADIYSNATSLIFVDVSERELL